MNINISTLSKSHFFTVCTYLTSTLTCYEYHGNETYIKTAVKKRADQPAHPHGHISTFLALCLGSIIHIYKIICILS